MIRFYAQANDTAPGAAKNDAHNKSGQNWHKNNHLATLIWMGKTDCRLKLHGFRLFGSYLDVFLETILEKEDLNNERIMEKTVLFLNCPQ